MRVVNLTSKSDIEYWMVHLGIDDHKITDTNIVGEVKRELGIHSIIVFTKKVIYRIIKIEEKPHIIMVLKRTEKHMFKKNTDTA